MDSQQLAVRIARLADDKKASDIHVLWIADLLVVTDFFVICSGNTDRQVKTIAQTIRDELKGAGVRPLWVDGESQGAWVVMDYGSVVAHIFRLEEREYYRLEKLWRDAPSVEWSGEG